METNYFVIKFENRADGIVNQSMARRASLASALSDYHSTLSKSLVMTEAIETVTVMVIDNFGNVIIKNHVHTLYVAPEDTEE